MAASLLMCEQAGAMVQRMKDQVSAAKDAESFMNVLQGLGQANRKMIAAHINNEWKNVKKFGTTDIVDARGNILVTAPPLPPGKPTVPPPPPGEDVQKALSNLQAQIDERTKRIEQLEAENRELRVKAVRVTEVAPKVEAGQPPAEDVMNAVKAVQQALNIAKDAISKTGTKDQQDWIASRLGYANWDNMITSIESALPA